MCVLCSLLVIWRSNASMFGCSFVQVPSTHCMSSAGDTLLGLSGKGHSCLTGFLCCPQDTRRVSITRLWKILQSARVTELLGIILFFEVAPMLLDGLSILDMRVGDSCSSSGLSALDFMYSSTTSCIRSSTYSEETQFTFLLKYVILHVTSWK